MNVPYGETAGFAEGAQVGGERGGEDAVQAGFCQVYLVAVQGLAGKEEFFLQGRCPAAVYEVQEAG